ncbi:hypothetical protein [Hymenobacter defluvii]|uniref:Lipoprotein n=1 Tax=Hymenobacter defluvii TaxID=2054411 RepID=A0ABS3TDN2_9BACT|nr:hypothetical protein [Hymenobacter defluvii]MBO3271764.1 hypothetical protein [Hymenobacter defluvii]
MKVTHIIFCALSCWGGLALSGCQDKDTDPAADELVQVSYAQTACSDPWIADSTGVTAFETAATAYLQKQGVQTDQLQAAQTGEYEPCNACHCKTGIILEGGVRRKDLATVEKLGFRKL